MSLNYEHLDDRTRQSMQKEVDLDISIGLLYISSRLNSKGIEKYPSLLEEAIQSQEDAWLADQLRCTNYMNATEKRKKRGGGFSTAKVPITAPDTLAEGEFNRF